MRGLHRGNKNIAADKCPSSRVSITAERITWHDTEKADVPLLSMMCERAPAPQAAKKPFDPNELIGIVRGSLCPTHDVKLSARWKITDNDVLLVWVQVAEFKGNRNGTYTGASATDVLLTCQRMPVPDASPPDPSKDAGRFVDKWAVLCGWAKEAVEKQELRQPPPHFGSDGNRNMWVLRRMSAPKIESSPA